MEMKPGYKVENCPPSKYADGIMVTNYHALNEVNNKPIQYRKRHSFIEISGDRVGFWKIKSLKS